MNNEKKKAIITDLSQLRKKDENQPFLHFAEEIIKQIELGKTKEEVLYMILDISGGLKTDPREMKYFTDMVDIVYKWYYKNEGREMKTALKDLLIKMEENQKYLYKGKDGKTYATRAELEEANEYYKNQICAKNPSKNM